MPLLSFDVYESIFHFLSILLVKGGEYITVIQKIAMKTEKKQKDGSYNAEITQEDLNALGAQTQNQRTSQQGDDKQLTQREKAVDFSGADLDVPGRTLPKDRAASSLKDEENQLHSQGSGHNDHLEDHPNHSPKK